MEGGKGAQKKELWGTVLIAFYLLTLPRIVFTSCKFGECPSISRILNDSPGSFLSEIRLLAMTWSDLNLAYLRSVTSLWPLAPSDVQPWPVINKVWFHFLKSSTTLALYKCIFKLSNCVDLNIVLSILYSSKPPDFLYELVTVGTATAVGNNA